MLDFSKDNPRGVDRRRPKGKSRVYTLAEMHRLMAERDATAAAKASRGQGRGRERPRDPGKRGSVSSRSRGGHGLIIRGGKKMVVDNHIPAGHQASVDFEEDDDDDSDFFEHSDLSDGEPEASTSAGEKRPTSSRRLGLHSAQRPHILANDTVSDPEEF